jgi:hypothetical protein
MMVFRWLMTMVFAAGLGVWLALEALGLQVSFVPKGAKVCPDVTEITTAGPVPGLWSVDIDGESAP